MDALNLNTLVELLNPKTESDSEDDDVPSNTMCSMNPGNIKPKTVSQKPVQDKKQAKDIWDTDDVAEGSEYDSIYDSRPQPDYEIVYKQAVTTEDMYLQMGNKTPSSASCEAMVVKITLPDSNLSEIDLDIKPKFLDCRTPKYRLGLHLPHPVDDKSGSAQWDKSTCILRVTLTMNREYDFMNL